MAGPPNQSKEPPENHRFVKGKSGNPGGRPKKTKNELDAKIIARCESEIPNSKNTVLDAVFNGLIKAAAQGDVRAARTIFDLYREASRRRGQSIVSDEADIRAAKRILNLDPRLFADLPGQEPITKKHEAPPYDDNPGNK